MSGSQFNFASSVELSDYSQHRFFDTHQRRRRSCGRPGETLATALHGGERVAFRDLTHFRTQASDGGQCLVAVEKKGLSIRPGAALLKKAGWKQGDKIGIAIGEGPNAGFARLSPNERGWALRTSGSLALQVLIARSVRGVPLFPDAPSRMPTTATAAEVVKGGIQFALPWIKEPGVIEDVVEKPALQESAPAPPPPEAPEAEAVEPGPALQEGHPAEGIGAEAVTVVNFGKHPDPTDKPEHPDTGGDAFPTAMAAPEAEETPISTVALPPYMASPAEPARHPAPPWTGRMAELRALSTRAPTPTRPPGSDIGRMSDRQAHDFVQAAARRASRQELRVILVRPPGKYASGSLDYWKNKLADRIAAARDALPPERAPNRAERAAAATLTHPSDPWFGADHPAAAKQPSPAGITAPALISAAAAKLSDAVLEQLRVKAGPVLARAGYKVKKNADDTAILIDGLSCTPEDVFALANQTLKDDGLEPITLETT